jgi:hypothetical protein
MGSGSLSGYFLKRFKESKGGSCSPPGGFPRIRRYGRFKLFDRILLMEPKGFLLSTRRLLLDQEMGSSFIPGCYLKSQSGIPALHQEASPGSGEGLFRVFAMNAPQSAPLLVAERLSYRHWQWRNGVNKTPPFVHFTIAKGGKKTIAHLLL